MEGSVPRTVPRVEPLGDHVPNARWAQENFPNKS